MVTTTSDLGGSLLTWMRGAVTGALLSFQVDGTPSPTSRPRVAKFGTYYAKPYAAWLQECTKQLATQRPAEKLEGDLVAYLDVRVERPKATKLARPKGDADNYAKAPLDGATKAGIWSDDGQAILIAASKRWAEPGELPGVTLHVGRIGTA